MTASEQTAALAGVMEVIGGLPLLLHVPPERLALTALARASADGPLILLVDDAETRRALQERLTEIEAVYEKEDVSFGTPQFALALPANGCRRAAAGDSGRLRRRLRRGRPLRRPHGASADDRRPGAA